MVSRLIRKLSSYKPSSLIPDERVCASVLIPIFESDSGTRILLTKRTTKVKHHKGEVSFPGGMYEETDADTKKTALRECCEEIGVKTGDVDIIGRLDDLTTLTGFVITPYVGVIPYPYAFKINQKEVAYLVYLPFEHLESSDLVQEKIEYRGRAETIDCFYYNGERIWGATCRMLLTLKRIVHDE